MKTLEECRLRIEKMLLSALYISESSDDLAFKLGQIQALKWVTGDAQKDMERMSELVAQEREEMTKLIESEMPNNVI